MNLWLTRYRFTAEFLALTIEDAFRNPDALLNAYIYSFGAFHPTDCGNNSLLSDEVPSSYQFSFSSLQFEKVEAMKHGEFLGLRIISNIQTRLKVAKKSVASIV